MDKAILVIDIPKNCLDCVCSMEVFSKHICEAKQDRQLSKVNMTENKPSWCPLKEMPEKSKDTVSVGGINGGIASYLTEYAEGWNDCIDEILEEEKE